MSLRRATRKPENETIVALIDVVFFLLVFFLLVGRMDATAPFEVLPPVAQTGADLPAGGITVQIGSGGELALDGTTRERAALLEEVARALRQDPTIRIRIQSHAETQLRHVLPLVTQIETLGARDVTFVVTPDPT